MKSPEKVSKSPEKKIESVDPKDLKSREQSTSFKEQPPCTYSPQVVNIELSGLSGQETDYSIKKACEGLHIVNIVTDTDNISGECKGKAIITIRGKGLSDSKLLKVQNEFSEKGVKMAEFSEEPAAKMKYENMCNLDWKDPKIKARPSTANPRCQKLNNLESSPGIVGNIGKWSEEWKGKSVKQSVDPSLLENFKWQRTKSRK